MNDLIPCTLAHSNRIHAAEHWGGPTLCRPLGPPPIWYTPLQWTAVGPACPNCRAIALAHHQLEHAEEQVARW